MSTSAATVESSSPSPAAPFEAFLSSLLAGRNANKSATAGSTSGDHSSPSPASAAPSTASATSVPEMVVNAKSTVDATHQIDSPSLSSTSTPPSPPSTSSLPSSPSSPSSSSSSGDTAPPTETTDERLMQSSAGSTATANTTTNNTARTDVLAKATQGAVTAGSESSAVPFDVTSSSGREALLLRFLHLLPDIHELQQSLNQPHVGGGDESKACQQLVLEAVVALRLWVVQQPLTLGRPLSADNPSLFTLLRPQLGRLPWWRAPTYTAAPSRYPTTSASTSSSVPPVPPLEDDLLALAWGNRAWQPSAPDAASAAVKKEDGSSPASSPPLPSTHHNLSVPVVKIDHPLPHQGGSSSSAGTVIGTIKMAGAGPTENNEGFEFNENDSALVPAPAAGALHNSKRRRSMDATLEVAGIMARQPARDQALRKRRKSVIERTSTTAAAAPRQEEETAGRDLRKRKASVPSPNAAAGAVQHPDRRSEEAGGMSPKKIKFDDEDYIDTHGGGGGSGSGREGGEKEKEAHRDVADSATPVRGVRGRGARGRGARGAKTRGGRGGRGGNREKDLEGVPKTKARKPESCHRCKNKKEFWVGCPLVASHKYCRGCVVRHFAIDYDDFRANPESYWTDGCPICHLTCPCIGCVRKKKNGQQGGAGGNEDEDRVDVEKDDDDEVGDPDEDEDEDDAEGYGDDDGEDDGDEDGDGEEDDAHIDVDVNEDDDLSEQKSVENLIEVKWSALKRQLDVKDSSAEAASEAGQGHLPVKKRMSRLRSNSFANGNGPSSRASASSMAILDEALAHHVQQQQQPPRKRAPRLRSYSTSHCSDPKPTSAAVNPEDFLGRTGAGSVLAARYNSPMRRGSRGFNSRGTH